MGLTSDRRRLLAQVHIAKKELGLSDEDYRSVLRQLFQKDSARDLSMPQLLRLVNYFRLRGWRPGRRRRHRPPASERERLCRKAWAICASLGLPWSYADGTARKMFGVERLVWCTPEQLRRVVAALEYHRRRHQNAEEKD